MRKARSLAAQAMLVATTVGRNVADDPLGFALLVARRFASAKRGWFGKLTGVGVVPALGAYLADRPQEAASALRGRADRRWGGRFAARLAVAVGAPDAVPVRMRSDARVVSDVAWAQGDLSGAIAALGDSRGLKARRRRSELDVLNPGTWLAGPATRVRRPTDPTRVLHILTNSLPHTRSGYTSRTHAILRASQAAGVTVSAVTRLGYPVTIGKLGVAEADVIDGIAYHRLLTAALPVDAKARLEAQVRALEPLVESFAPGVLHTTTDFTNALVTEALARRHGLPWVYEMRGQLELTWVASRPEPWREAAAASERVRLLRAKEAELAAAADAVVVLSQVQADDMVARGVSPDRILAAPNSIDPALLERDVRPLDARAMLGLPVEGVWAGTVSSLVDYEGLDTFLRALAVARERGVDVRGAIVGDGVSRPGLIALAATLGISDAVVFPGRVPAIDAMRWHEALDVFVVPRRDTPVCRMVTPLKPVEAMALGRPVIASDLPALREIVGPRSGLLVPAADVESWAMALATLARDRRARVDYGMSGRYAAQRRTWQHVGQSFATLYQEVTRG